jgi:anti-anti-sigma factor
MGTRETGPAPSSSRCPTSGCDFVLGCGTAAPSTVHPALFSAEVELLDGGAVVRFVGELDLAQAPAAEEQALRGLRSSHRGAVVIDLSELRYCDSSGLRVFAHVDRQAQAQGRHLVFRSPRPVVRRVLEIAGIDKWIAVEGSEHLPPAA